MGVSLSAVVEAGDSNLVNDYVARSEGSPIVLAQLAEAYARFEPTRSYTPQEMDLFKRIFESKDPAVLFRASHMIRQVANRSPAFALELICLADFEANIRATHDMFMWISGNNKVIPEGDINSKRRMLLSKLIVLDRLDDYWIRAFLEKSTEKDPISVVGLVIARLREAKRRNDWHYVPLSKEYDGKGLGLMKVETGPRLLRDFLDVALEESKDIMIAEHIGDSVAGFCGNYDQPLLDLLLDWMSSGKQAHAILVARILWKSQPTLIYEHPKFIREILNAAELLGKEALDEIRSAIAAAAHSGLRHGTPGEPFPEDVRMKEYSDQILATLSRAEPAFDLYDGLLKYANREITRQRKSKEALEDEDE